jgi:hypothetical protein
MRTKLLLFLILILFGGVLRAQDTIRTLIISEARFDQAHEAYVELTNVGDSTLHLKNFEFGHVGPWTSRNDVNNLGAWFAMAAGDWFMLPDWTLAPGKSIVIANVNDWNLMMWKKDPDHYGPITKAEMWKVLDIRLDQPEAPNSSTTNHVPGDSVSTYFDVGQVWGGRDCWYVRHHVAPGDSVVVDQVGGVFDGAASDGVAVGSNKNQAYDVAGVTQATVNDILVRKYTIKKGNIDFNSGRGTSLAESEWIPIPILVPGGWEPNRALFWTVKNHLNAQLSSLTSSSITIHLADSTLLVPWGVRDDDSIMYQFNRIPGIAWHYNYGPKYADSAYVTVRTGDVFTIYACGNVMQQVNFKITVADPTNDMNIVIPKKVPDKHLRYLNAGPFCEVTDKVAGMDTIRGSMFLGIPFATRVDTLYKYLDKPSNAAWEIVWVDGKERTDLLNGDILKVTSHSGTAKEYFIKVAKYRPAHNALLASITWPDIPDAYRGLYGWSGDTIPNFVDSKYQYTVQVPFDVNGIPALVAKNEDINAKLAVERAKSLSGSTADKTVTFTSTAEDDTTIVTYNIQLDKEKAIANVQPYISDPFISQFIWQEQWANAFIEVVNPGNKPLDMSKYMFCWGYVNDPATAITRLNKPTDWLNRYGKYIPGTKWVDSTLWKTEPATATQDLNVNPIVAPGDVFVIGDVWSWGTSGYPWFASKQCDVDLGPHNPWNEPTNNWNALQEWNGANYFLFRIENDSVTRGLKPATNPNDFTLIESWGSGTGADPTIGGLQMQQINGYVRKPYIYKAKDAGFTTSFGTDATTSEWLFTDRNYYDALHTPWPNDILFVADGLGSHFMNEVTVYKSTIGSNAYKLTDGYVSPQSLWGIVTGTTVADFEKNILKADTGQTLTVLSHADGSVVGNTTAVSSNDTLKVVSNDKKNTTKYVLTVTAGGLSNDAVLTSTAYTIGVTDTVGTVTGFKYGTNLKTIVDSVTVPTGASFTVIDGHGAYVAFKVLNPDTVYVDTKVSDQIFFEVIAENGTTKIVYQLKPTSSNTDAFVTSDVYMVNQETALIDFVPEGTTVYGLFRFLTPAPGATFKLLDKFGFERTTGDVVRDDLLKVTAADGVTTKTYHLAMLGLKLVYYAYVASEVYAVDQVNFTITSPHINTSTLAADFLANLTAAPSATVMLTDSLGAAATGTLTVGDKVVVTAGDGVTKATYTISVLTTVKPIQSRTISVYPNPSSGQVSISGIELGNRIEVTNILGQQLYAKVASHDVELISLEGQPSGIYIISVINNNKVLGRYKLLLK